jgi:hypothetical protein
MDANARVVETAHELVAALLLLVLLLLPWQAT